MVCTTIFQGKDPKKQPGSPRLYMPLLANSLTLTNASHLRYDLNRSQSPFLRLPYELRLHIYKLLLGNRQVHIRFVPWRQHKRQTKNGIICTDTVKGRFVHDILDKGQDPWGKEVDTLRIASLSRHCEGTVTGTQRLTLLSGVCRQLYHETALLPHCLNTWSFENMHVMDKYIIKENKMPLQQRRAIRTLWCKERIPKALQQKLGGLEVIIWKIGPKLRWQDLALFPDTSWKDKRELRERSFRWSTIMSPCI